MNNRLKQIVLGLAVLSLTAMAEDGARYLVIAADVLVDATQPLAQWKTRKGVLAKVVPVSEAGSNTEEIRAYIRNAYYNWPVRPEYVLIVGCPLLIRSPSNFYDTRYGDMTGDYKMEISVGRLPAENIQECSTMVNKVLTYEKPSQQGDTTWYLKGATVVREDNPPDQYYQADSRFARNYWINSGYILPESLSDFQGHNSYSVSASASNGRAFITYRGLAASYWISPFNNINPYSWTNGPRMPVVIAATCETVTLAPYESMYGDKFIRAGSPDGQGGAIAYFGTTRSGQHISKYRSAVYRGFFRAFFEEEEYRLGPATLRARFRCDSLYHAQSKYEEWNLLGDPELNVWTGVPRQPEVEYDSVLVMAPQVFRVTVRVAGSPVANALVCVSMDSVVYEHDRTNASGQVELSINPTHVGTMALVVTGRNLRPFEGTCTVAAGGVPYPVITGTRVDDYLGNNDGVINPGERFRLQVGLHNIGGVTATGVGAFLHIADPGVTVHDSLAAYGTILPDSTVYGEPFDIAVGTMFKEGQEIAAALEIWDSEADTWTRSLNLEVRAGKLKLVSVLLLDSPPAGNGNGRLGPNESGRLQLAVTNNGGGLLNGIAAVLASLDTNVLVIDSTAFYGRAGPGDSLSGTFDRFGISASPGLIATQPLPFLLKFLGDGGTYLYADTIEMEVPNELGTGTGPTGPDAYGYWCYDDTDTATGRAPVYDWLELEPPGPGERIDSVSDKDAATITCPLPFTFRYYGQDYSFISICSNGFLAMGYADYRFGNNRSLPDTGGAAAMVAPFWDDLNPDESHNGYGTAYQYYDTLNHRWICEYEKFAHYHQRNIRETFQAVFYDPVYRPTPTGDGEIEFLYNRVSLNSGCTVGIENYAETIALQYLYNNQYEPGAAYLRSGRAIKFTTWPPEGRISPWLVLVRVQASDSIGGNNNGQFEAGETLTVVVTIRNQGTASAVNTAVLLCALDPDAMVMDSTAQLGTIPVEGQATNNTEPFVFRIAELPSDSILDFELEFSADGYVTTGYFSIGLSNVTGIAEQAGKPLARTCLEPIRPNPLGRSASIRYGLAYPGFVDLALFDVTGRRVQTLVRGVQEQGFHAARLEAAELSQGVYFCRLSVQDNTGIRRFVQKIQLAR